ncbi:MAG: ABC transporter permease [Bacteroidota bacterium]
MNLHFLFAWRYFKAKKTTNAINVISWISIVAIVFGSAALIIVLSVFNGFEGMVKSLYSSFYPDVIISPASGKQLTFTEDQLQRLRSVKGVQYVSLVAEEKALLKNGESQTIITLKGVDSTYTKVSAVGKHIIKGNFETGTPEAALLVLGSGVENAVGVQSDRNIFPLTVYVPRKGELSLADPMRSLSVDTLNTAGAFFIQQEFDNKFAITNLQFVKNLLGMQANEYTGAELLLEPMADAEILEAELKQILGPQYLVQNRFQQNASLFSVMQVEKWMIYAILSLILVVAAFNMIGALTMLVLEKKKDISVLHSMGASRGFIKNIFLSSGVLIAVIGGGMGMLIAFIIGWAQTKYHLIPLQGNTFMIDYFPVKMVYTDFILVGITVFVIAMIASYIPAGKAAKQQFLLRSE